MDKSILKKFYTFILDIIFPIHCLGCNLEGSWICKSCLQKIPIENNSICPLCHINTNQGEYCSKCSISSKMKGIILASSYENELLQKIIQNFKYKYITDLKNTLADILAHKLNNISLNLSNFIIIPIPLHKKKYKFRGFNQAELLGHALSEILKVETNPNIIKRIKYTSAQAKLSPLKRRKNIKNAFKISANISQNYLSNKKVLLVDDVCTTSSTLEECTKELSKLRPKEIWGLVLARGK